MNGSVGEEMRSLLICRAKSTMVRQLAALRRLNRIALDG
jgi:hypothetical protein